MDSEYPVNFDANISSASSYLKVLANPERLKVMCKISQHPCSVSELVDVTGLSQPALSMHLSRLRDAGMVNTQREGKKIHYSISSRELKQLVEQISYSFQCW